jgi:hypothetical protein
MNGNSALLDSNILIYLSKNELPFSILDQFAALFVSVISYMEVLGYRFTNRQKGKAQHSILLPGSKKVRCVPAYKRDSYCFCGQVPMWANIARPLQGIRRIYSGLTWHGM